MVRILVVAGARLARSSSVSQIRHAIAGTPWIRPIAGSSLIHEPVPHPRDCLFSRPPIRCLGSSPQGKDLQTLVVVMDHCGRASIAESSSLVAQRLTNAVSRELSAMQSELETKSAEGDMISSPGELEPVDVQIPSTENQVEDMADITQEKTEAKDTQLRIEAWERLAAGHDLHHLSLAVARLRYISRAVYDLKTAHDK